MNQFFLIILFILTMGLVEVSLAKEEKDFFLYKGVRISSLKTCLEGSSLHNKQGCAARQLVDQGIADTFVNKSRRPLTNQKSKMASVKQHKHHHFTIPGGGANPADKICQEVGGEAHNQKEANGDEISICRFSDTSFIYSWDLIKIIK